MPLKYGTSNETREENIEREIAAGKKPKQAVAIGYETQRRARAGKKPKGKRGHFSHSQGDGRR